MLNRDADKELKMDKSSTKPANELPTQNMVPEVPGYEIIELLGRGGMSLVFRARQIDLDRIVALKILARGAYSEEELTVRFQTEARAIAKLQHANIAEIYDIGVCNGQPYLALEFLENGTLAKQCGDPWSPQGAAKLLATLARAIDYSHRQGVIHRDLKPANIMFDAEGRVKIVDFGLARFIDSVADVTRDGAILGTPRYMAPEQASGVVKRPGPACDVYALGNILYELLVGRPPFLTDDSARTMLMVLCDEPIRPRRLQPRVPKDLETICLKCLEKSPRKRFLSGQDLAEDLDRFANGEPIRSRHVGIIGRSIRWANRHPLAAIPIAISCLLLLTLIIGGWLYNTQLRATNKHLVEANRRTERLSLAGQDLASWALFTHTDSLRKIEGSSTTQLELADRMQQYLNEISTQVADDPKLTTAVAEAYERLAQIQGDPSEQNTGQTSAAFANYQHAMKLRKKLLDLAPNDERRQMNYATVVSNLGNVMAALGEFDNAIEAQQEAIDIVSPIAKNSSHDRAKLLMVSFVIRIGDTNRDLGSLLQAEESYLHALELTEEITVDGLEDEIPPDAIVFNRLSELNLRLYEQTNDQSRLEKSHQYCIAQMTSLENMSDARKQDADIQRQKTQALSLNAKLQEKLHGASNSIETRIQLVELTGGRAKLDPQNITLQRDWSIELSQLGSLYLDTDENDKAIDCYLQSLEITKKIFELNPNSTQAIRDLCFDYESLGHAYLRSSRPEDSLAAFRKCHELATKFPKDNRADLIRLAQAERGLGVVIFRLSQLATIDSEKRDHLIESKEFLTRALETINKADSITAMKAELREFRQPIVLILDAIESELAR